MSFKIGEEVSGIVTAVENYGLYLELENNVKALLPKGNMFLSKKKKLKEVFSVGFVIKAKVQSEKEEYLVLSQKDLGKDNLSVTKETEVKTTQKKNKVNKKKIKSATKQEVDEYLNKQQNKEPREQKNNKTALADLKKLKNIGNIKISIKNDKKEIKWAEEKVEEVKELPKLPQGFMENFLEDVNEAFKRLEKIEKQIIEQGHLDEH